MSSRSNRQTFAKLTRERAVAERRARKQAKKDEKRRAAAAADETAPTLDESAAPPEIDQDEVRRLSRLR
jgi:hypothetical protein